MTSRLLRLLPGLSNRQCTALVAFSLLAGAGTATAGGIRVDVLGNAAVAQLTHTTCAVSPRGAGAANRFLMVEGPACKTVGEACPHVALMKIDRHTMSLPRVSEPRKAENGTWSSVFKHGEITLNVDLVPKRSATPSAGADEAYAATLTVRDGKGGTITVKGVARCDGD